MTAFLTFPFHCFPHVLRCGVTATSCTTFSFVYLKSLKELFFIFSSLRLEAKADAKVSGLFLFTKYFSKFFFEMFFGEAVFRSRISFGAAGLSRSLAHWQGKILGSLGSLCRWFFSGFGAYAFSVCHSFSLLSLSKADAKVRTFSFSASVLGCFFTWFFCRWWVLTDC